MSWAKIDDRLFLHPKFLRLSLNAAGLWLFGLSYAASLERDGWFPSDALSRLTVTPDCESYAHELVHAGLWMREPDGYRIHDFLKYNWSRKQLTAKRNRDARRQQRSRARHGVTHGVSPRGVTDSRPVPSRPVPKEEDPTPLGFAEFWLSYPKKRHKPDAERAWKRVHGDDTLAAIVAGVGRWKASDAWRRGFIEDPATFLRQRQWEDDPAKPTQRTLPTTGRGAPDAAATRRMLAEKGL